jgi:hypothetical protein
VSASASWAGTRLRNNPGTLSLRPHSRARFLARAQAKESATTMHGIIYLIGLVVVVLAILSFLGLS